MHLPFILFIILEREEKQMIQIYFLSIFFNVLVGYILISEDDKNTQDYRPGFSLKDETVRLVLGVLSIITGVLKLLSPIEGSIVILGDLLPAAAGLASGFVLVIEYYRSRSTIYGGSENRVGLDSMLINNRKIIGYITIAVAILHFFFPRVVFL